MLDAATVEWLARAQQAMAEGRFVGMTVICCPDMRLVEGQRICPNDCALPTHDALLAAHGLEPYLMSAMGRQPPDLATVREVG